MALNYQPHSHCPLGEGEEDGMHYYFSHSTTRAYRERGHLGRRQATVSGTAGPPAGQGNRPLSGQSQHSAHSWRHPHRTDITTEYSGSYTVAHYRVTTEILTVLGPW